jgi:hypothetical protein
MANNPLPSSGQISFADINIELGRNATASIGIDNAENGDYAPINRCGGTYPLATNPAAISEWYGYNHLAAATLLGDFDYSATSCAVACALTPAGSGLWVASEIYYTTNICTVTAADGYYADISRTTCYYIAGGNLQSTSACTTTTTTTTTTTAACTPTGQSGCSVDTDCCNYPIAVCSNGTCLEV